MKASWAAIVKISRILLCVLSVPTILKEESLFCNMVENNGYSGRNEVIIHNVMVA